MSYAQRLAVDVCSACMMACVSLFDWEPHDRMMFMQHADSGLNQQVGSNKVLPTTLMSCTVKGGRRLGQAC